MSGTDLHELFVAAVSDAPPISAQLPQQALASGRRLRRARRGWTAAGVCSVVSVAVVVSVSVAQTGPGATTVPPAHASSTGTDLWRSFPVTASPRPIVLTGPKVNDPADGFGSGDGKLAFSEGNFVFDGQVPTAPAQSAGYPLVPADQALATLRAIGAGQAATRAPALRITDIRLGSAEFATDRGPRALPAWLFDLEGVSAPVSVLAVAPPAVYPAPVSGYSPLGLAPPVGSDTRSLTVTFVGAHAGTGPCDKEYAAFVVQTRWAVGVSIFQTRHGADPSPTLGIACADIGFARQVSVPLDAALGNRVVVGVDDGIPLSLSR